MKMCYECVESPHLQSNDWFGYALLVGQLNTSKYDTVPVNVLRQNMHNVDLLNVICIVNTSANVTAIFINDNILRQKLSGVTH